MSKNSETHSICDKHLKEQGSAMTCCECSMRRDCSNNMQPTQKPWWEEYKNKFENILSKFISFVEDECNRDKEKSRGIVRRDGGRKINAHINLKQLIVYIDTESRLQAIEDCINEVGSKRKVFDPDTNVPELIDPLGVDGYNLALSDISTALSALK